MLPVLLLLACTPKDPGQDSSPPLPQPAPARPAEPAAWVAPGTLDSSAFPWAPQAGDPSADGVILSVRSDLGQLTGLVMVEDGAGGWVEHSRPLLQREEGSLVARARLSDLPADRAFTWAAYPAEPGEGVARSGVGRFRTATDADSWRTLVVAATSCLGGNPPLPNMSRVAEQAPDLGLLLGDIVYADDATTLEEYRAYWDEVMRQPGQADFVGGMGVVATWDDHEVTNNYERAELAPGRFEDALAAFRESMPQELGPQGGVWRRQSWGAILDVFVLDVRSERDPAAGLYIGAEQEQWLLDGLRDSPAAFKLVLTTVPITDYTDFIGEIQAEDRWQGWPEQRDRVLTTIDEAGIEGLLWLAGDVHFAAVSTLAVPGTDDPGQSQVEVLAGPAGSFPNVAADLYEGETGQYLSMFSTFNSLLLSFDPGLMAVDVVHLGDDGAELSRIRLEL